MSRAKQDSQSQKFTRTLPKNCSHDFRELLSKTRDLRHVLPGHSPERSAKSLSCKFFVIPSSALNQIVDIVQTEGPVKTRKSSRSAWNSESRLVNTWNTSFDVVLVPLMQTCLAKVFISDDGLGSSKQVFWS